MQPNPVIVIASPAGRAVRVGNAERLAVIAGPCQLESRAPAQ
jgi:2-dehydro-3-deoxyphosphooctonate aldolase (KDO 8-P synthase)